MPLIGGMGMSVFAAAVIRHWAHGLSTQPHALGTWDDARPRHMDFFGL